MEYYSTLFNGKRIELRNYLLFIEKRFVGNINQLVSFPPTVLDTFS